MRCLSFQWCLATHGHSDAGQVPQRDSLRPPLHPHPHPLVSDRRDEGIIFSFCCHVFAAQTLLVERHTREKVTRSRKHNDAALCPKHFSLISFSVELTSSRSSDVASRRSTLLSLPLCLFLLGAFHPEVPSSFPSRTETLRKNMIPFSFFFLLCKSTHRGPNIWTAPLGQAREPDIKRQSGYRVGGGAGGGGGSPG